MKTILEIERNNQAQATSENTFFAGYAGIMPAFFKKMRASRPRSQGFSELAYT